MKIYMIVGNNKPVVIDKARTIDACNARIARYEREDRYEIEVEKYTMPAAWCGEYPKYIIGK